ncbi:hypothetical protein [Massilia sp. CCM 8734]|uniref:hypothetical protein n=1 Tax=Massilia sp. CCM 8734 TaxID=2609283 RepID=UPI00141FF37F|nr:hypothetical protein [Massilia sp. CCM 8734]NHZ95377.1 hypothetical protein [Massilia sp. CCM 8734]
MVFTIAALPGDAKAATPDRFNLTAMVQRSKVYDALQPRSCMVKSKTPHKAKLDLTRFHM